MGPHKTPEHLVNGGWIYTKCKGCTNPPDIFQYLAWPGKWLYLSPALVLQNRRMKCSQADAGVNIIQTRHSKGDCWKNVCTKHPRSRLILFQNCAKPLFALHYKSNIRWFAGDLFTNMDMKGSISFSIVHTYIPRQLYICLRLAVFCWGLLMVEFTRIFQDQFADNGHSHNFPNTSEAILSETTATYKSQLSRQ